MKTRLLTSAALTVSAALFAAGCGGSDSSSTSAQSSGAGNVAAPTFAAGSTMDAIQKKGRLTVGIKFDQNGFGLKNPTTGKVEGFDVQIADLLAQGIFGGSKADAEGKIDFVEAVSKNREPFIQDGKVDVVVATYTINDTRKQVVDFAGPYYVAHGDIMVKDSDSTIKSVTDLNGKNVCAVQGSTYPATLKAKAPQANVTQLDNYSLCTEALRDGRVQAVTTDSVILAGIVQANDRAFKLVNANYTDEPYGIGLKKGDDAFRTFLNDRLQSTFDNGDWKKAYEDTLGKIGLSTPAPPAINRYVAGAASAPTTTAVTTTTAKP